MKSYSLSRSNSRLFILYVSPWLIGFAGLVIGPMIYSLALSFTDSTIGDMGRITGFANYIRAFSADKLFLKSLANTLVYTAAFVPLTLIFSLSIAMLINQKLKYVGLYRVAFYVPSITAGVAVTLLWGWIFNPSFGLLNYALSLASINGPNWLGSSAWAMPAIIIMNMWTQGNMIVIFLAGLQEVPEQLYESARIDGANWLMKTFRITLPLITPTVFFNLIIGMIVALQMFNQPYILTKGGPMDATYVYMLHIYNQAFRYGQMGYACSLAWLMLIAIVIITSVIVRSSRIWVHYSED
jgi:multiple sugar transport system permease protein